MIDRRNLDSADERAPRRQDDIDAAIDAAMKQAAAPALAPETPLKRQWDDALESELEAALAGFDASTFDVPSPRARAADRAHVPRQDRGQEAAPGPRKGRVIAVRGNSVFVDVGGKGEGVVPLEQFGGTPPEKDALIDVVVERFDVDEGLAVLSIKGAAVEADWATLRKEMIVEARGVKAVKGGLEVSVNGIRGFCPISALDLNRIEDVNPFINQKFRAIVTEVNSREKNLVVSRRLLLEQERAEQAAKTWAELEEGQTRRGVVRSVKDFGVFVDMGGVDGLIAMQNLAWSRVKDASSIVRIGDEVDVKVLKIDRVTRKVSLGLKQLAVSPWDSVESKYPRGAVVTGKVTRLMDFGAFVELEPGIEGLIHISELGTNRVRRVADVVKADQEVEVRILKVDAETNKIALTLRPSPTKQPEPEVAAAEEEPEPERKPVTYKTPLKGGLD